MTAFVCILQQIPFLQQKPAGPGSPFGRGGEDPLGPLGKNLAVVSAGELLYDSTQFQLKQDGQNL